jgi:hypothetical protein
MNNFDNLNEDVGDKGRKKVSTKRAQLIKRMMKAYKKTKRSEKIDKLMNNADHWKGLE